MDALLGQMEAEQVDYRSLIERQAEEAAAEGQPPEFARTVGGLEYTPTYGGLPALAESLDSNHSNHSNGIVYFNDNQVPAGPERSCSLLLPVLLLFVAGPIELTERDFYLSRSLRRPTPAAPTPRTPPPGTLRSAAAAAVGTRTMTGVATMMAAKTMMAMADMMGGR